MKAIIFFLALLALCVNVAIGQTTSKFEHISSKLASTAQVISKEDYKRIQELKLKSRADFPLPFTYYKVGDVLVNIKEQTINKNEVYSFKDKKRIFQEVADGDTLRMKLFSSEIQRYGDLDYLVTHYQFEGDEWYAFTSQEYGERKYLFGHLHFSAKDSGKAAAILKEMLSK